MVFVFEPVFLSFSPVPRIKGGSFGEKLGEFLPAFFTRTLDRFIHIPVTPGKVRAGLLVAAGAFILWGVSAGQRAKIGYSTPGTPLYAPHAKVNQDLEAIAQDFPLDEGWVVVTAPRYPQPAKHGRSAEPSGYGRSKDLLAVKGSAGGGRDIRRLNDN